MASTTSKVGRRAWMLVDIDIQGRIYRYTDAPDVQRITDATGEVFAYAPGLAPMPIKRRSDAVTTTASVTINASPAVSWALMYARGATLERSPVIIRRWYEATILDQADLYIRGRLTSPTWGDSTEPLTFSVERLRRESGVIPSDDMLISSKTWPVDGTFAVDPSANGRWYPMVFGSPTGAMTPAYLVEFLVSDLVNCKLLIAGHAVAASSVTLHDVKGEQAESTPVLEAVDLLGRTISYVDFNTVTFAPEEDREYRIAWDIATGGQGYKHAAVALHGAAGIMEALIQTWSDLDLDAGRFSAQRSAIDVYLLGFVITEQVATWDVISDLLDLLPVEWTESAAGEYPRVWRIGATAADAVGHIDATRLTGRYTRVSAIQTTGRIANRFTMQYGHGGGQTTAQSAATIGSGLTLYGSTDTTGVITDSRCAASERIYGRRPVATMSTEMISDSTTALAILRMWALLYALPRRSMQVQGDLSLDSHPLNGVVTVSATDVHITDELALVRGKSTDGDTMTLDLLLIDSPLTRTRAIT